MDCSADEQREAVGGMTQSDEKGLEFPCAYPIKAMVRTSAEARRAVLSAVARHSDFSHREDVRVRPSRNGRFESITVTIQAASRAHLEAVYEDVRALDAVVMTL
jgi:putative lipoic acid-binding regulatory protein